MEVFDCTIESVIYHSEEQGFSILHVSREKPQENAIILINMVEVNVGMTIRVEGEWVTNKRYGKQFKVSSWEEIKPTDTYGIEKYLSSGFIKGIGPVLARTIVEAFGVATLDVIESHSEELLKIPKVGPKKAEQIWASYDRHKGIRDIMIFLKAHDISDGYATKIYAEYGEDSIEILSNNPYQLIYDVDGIGFLIADSIARKLGFGLDHPLRIKSGIIYTMQVHCDEGDTCVTLNSLLNKAATLLQINGALITDSVKTLIEDEELIEEDDLLFLPTLYHSEINIARTLYIKAITPSPLQFDESFVNIEQTEMFSNVKYDEDQKNAIRKAVINNVTIITGGPGTGKTTITHGIVNAFHGMGMKILMAAPTGKAADRLSEATGFEAKTIHRLLGAKPGGSYDFNEDNKLKGDILIVDEVSMVNTYLMNSLLKAVPDNMKVILIGDMDQLPCIGPGNILKDLIESNVLPTIKLTKIFRQAENSRIITNAHAINRGEYPIINNSKDSDFFFLREDNEENLQDYITDLVCNRLPKTYGVEPKEIQVLTPMKKYKAGTVELNKRLQQAINPSGDEIARGDIVFRVGDKVIQTKNNYEKNIFNGDTGIICGVNVEDKTLEVDFGDEIVFYDSTDMEELLHAYALTIHKSQGSEYPIVVMPVTQSHYHMLSKNLLYTGITRARKICILIGSKQALLFGIKNIRIAKRNTTLKQRLQNLANQN